ncbi:CLUMA_CG020431, isoform B [Clunio marinus]|uniref:CLUMA_CG020431, isoform B n=1 Tax=Clunio marinus TaxID=568069 RepID=A0A1J1J4Z6_9DIPT|nr:CLUMA_CG020431, isoform B [Clunio marinus]
MSSNTEESGGTIRVTRSSLRRMASSESLNDIETVSNTPTKAPAKKLETISERANLTQPLLNSPVSRRNRKISEQNTNTSSPARCVTRRMSLEKEIQLTPIPSRPARRSLSRTVITIDSDSDTQSLNVSDGRIKSSRKKRESTVDIINEEPENEQEVNAEMSTNQRDSSKDSDEVGESELNKSSENELELRNRSISKSPSCKLLENCRPLSVNIEKMSEINSTSVTVDEEQEKDDQVDTSAEKFPKVFSKKIRRSMDAIKETFDNVLDEMKNNFQAPTENKEKFFDCVNEVEEKSLDGEVEEKTTADVSLNTLVRGRRSIHDEAEIDMEEEEVNTMLKDFEAEIDSAFKNSPIKRIKTPKKTNSVSINDTIEISNDMEISNHEDSNMEISPNLNKTKSPRKSFEKAVNGSANKSIIQSETIVESEEVMEELPVDSSGKDVSDEEEKEEVSIKNSSTSERMSRSWSQSIKCTSEPIDKYNLNRKSEVIIKSPNQSVKYTTENKIPSSDESEDEDFEENSLIDDEAEVGSNESITNSELNYLEDNEVPDDGESLGSRDTNENEIEEEEDEENDSFLDENEVSDAYSMDSAEEMIESSPKKRRSRIIVASESDDEEKQEEEKKTSPQKNSQTPTKVTSTADDEMDENPPRSNKKEKSSNKRKRDEEKFNESIQMERKRVKMSETIIEERTSERLTVKMRESIINGTSEEFEGIAELFEEENSTQLPEKIQKSSKKHSEKNSQSQVNIESVLNKCDELMSAFNKEKKAKLALKRERKAQKLAKKQEEKRI